MGGWHSESVPKNGVIIRHATRAYSFETDWDELINREDLSRYLRDLLDSSDLPSVGGDFGEEILPPIVSQEVWAAGVTYYRSRTARIEESQTQAEETSMTASIRRSALNSSSRRPPHRVAGPGGRCASVVIHTGTCQNRNSRSWSTAAEKSSATPSATT